MTHPITPPPELLSKWEDEILKRYENVDVQLLNAYQAGADAELNAYCGWIENQSNLGQLSIDPEVRAKFRREVSDRLRADRRPKSPSPKQQALEALDSFVRLRTQNPGLNQWLLDLLDWDDPKVVSIRADWAKRELGKNKDKRGFAQAVLTKCNQCLQMHENINR